MNKSPNPLSNPGIEYMRVAQDEMATYATLIKGAQTALLTSYQAFKKANETSMTDDWPTRKRIAANLEEQYQALKTLTEAITKTLAEPTLEKMIVSAPYNSPKLPDVSRCLPMDEERIVNIALAYTFWGIGGTKSLSPEQIRLAESILSNLAP